MRLTYLLSAFMLLIPMGLLAQDNFGIQFQGDETILPMTYRDGINPVIEVYVNDRGPYRFMFDTGASGMARLDLQLQGALNLPAVDSLRVSDGSAVTRWLALVELNSIRLGGYEIQRPLALVRDYNTAGGDRIDGVIGLGFFPNATIELNFEKSQCIIRKKKLTPGAQVVPFTFEGGVPELEVVLPHKVFRGVIDTGNRGGFTFHVDDIPRSYLMGPPVVVGKGVTVTQQFEVMQGQLKGVLTFGAMAAENPLLNLNAALRKPNIGMLQLRKYNLTFDLGSRLLQIMRHTSGRPATPMPANEFTGAFEGGRVISADGSMLFIQRPGGMLLELKPLGEDVYGLVTVEGARFQFVRDARGVIEALKVSRDGGVTWEVAKKMQEP